MALLVDDVTKVADALEIGQRTIRIAKQSIFIGLGASFILMLIASFGLIPARNWCSRFRRFWM